MFKLKNIWAVSALALAAASALAAVSPEEAKKLGTTLTPLGAEIAANADKSIPAYSGGLTTAPAGYQKGSGMRPDPFASEKPLYTITGANAGQYAARLTAGAQELLKRYPSMRLDVFPTHRSAAVPKYVQDNTVKNATAVKTIDDGLGVEGTYAGIPFPIPKTGNEAMWNHLLRFGGHAYQGKYDSINVSASGSAVLATTGEIVVEYPYYDPKRTGQSGDKDIYFRTKFGYTAPARRAGEALLIQDYINPLQNGRKGWQYLPGQRRVKASPDLAYDTPNPATAGTSTFDDGFIFSGALDRFDWKLVGKKEMLLPYNGYKLVYAKDPSVVTTPNHLNPDFVRWELHRAWVVEGTLKPGKRHIYAKRTLYLDEDSWFALASDQVDARGQLYRAAFATMTPAYEQPAPAATTQFFYDFVTGSYNVIGLVGPHATGVSFSAPLPEKQWSADALAGAGVR